LEISLDGQNWTVIDHREDNSELNGWKVTKTFSVAATAPCRFVRLVNIGKNHAGGDCLNISAWEIFGSLIGSTEDLRLARQRARCHP
jgi:hypothetical protein